MGLLQVAATPVKGPSRTFFSLGGGSSRVVFLDSAAAFPVTQAYVAACLVLDRQGKGFSVDVLLPTFVQARCCLHE